MLTKIKRVILRVIVLFKAYLGRSMKLRKILRSGDPVKLNLGCGDCPQEGYVNVDIRLVPGVDLVADMRWCLSRFRGECGEIYISHVLEHFDQPGKSMRQTKGTVLHFLHEMNEMLIPGGVLRIAVPDFSALAGLYVSRNYPLYPKLLGRLCGEQNYPENVHKCLFDRSFLEFCLNKAGFQNVRTWSPEELNFKRDSSFDEIDGVKTSLNLVAEKTP